MDVAGIVFLIINIIVLLFLIPFMIVQAKNQMKISKPNDKIIVWVFFGSILSTIVLANCLELYVGQIYLSLLFYQSLQWVIPTSLLFVINLSFYVYLNCRNYTINVRNNVFFKSIYGLIIVWQLMSLIGNLAFDLWIPIIVIEILVMIALIIYFVIELAKNKCNLRFKITKSFIAITAFAPLVATSISIAIVIAESSPDFAPNIWMKDVDDSTKIQQMWLPESHDTMSYGASLTKIMAQTQTYNLEQQLNLGVRVLDVRLIWDQKTGVMGCFHGIDPLGGNDLQYVLKTVKIFLSNNPSETILYELGREDDPILGDAKKYSDTEFVDEFNKQYHEVFGEDYKDLLTLTNNPDQSTWTLEKFRGKFVCSKYYSKNTSGDNFNMSQYQNRISPYYEGHCGGGYTLTTLDKKMSDIYDYDVAQWTGGDEGDNAFSELNLNGHGGALAFGYNVPNPKGFAAKFVEKYKKDIINIIGTHNCLVYIDFAELWEGNPNGFYDLIIEQNLIHYHV